MICNAVAQSREEHCSSSSQTPTRQISVTENYLRNVNNSFWDTLALYVPTLVPKDHLQKWRLVQVPHGINHTGLQPCKNFRLSRKLVD